MRVISCLALSACAWLSATSCPARDLRVAFGQEKAPYLWIEDDRITGLEYDIVRSALAAAGDGLVAVTLPNRRVTIALSGNEFDMVTGIQINQAGDAFYSDEYLAYANYAITRKASHIKLDGLSDLFGHSVAIWQTAWEDLDLGKLRPAGRSGLDYTEFTSQYRQTKFFWVGRCDVNVIDRNIFLWYSRQLADQMDVSAELDFQNILPPIRVRAAFRDGNDRDAFNKRPKGNPGQWQLCADFRPIWADRSRLKNAGVALRRQFGRTLYQHQWLDAPSAPRPVSERTR